MRHTTHIAEEHASLYSFTLIAYRICDKMMGKKLVADVLHDGMFNVSTDSFTRDDKSTHRQVVHHCLHYLPKFIYATRVLDIVCSVPTFNTRHVASEFNAARHRCTACRRASSHSACGDVHCDKLRL